MQEELLKSLDRWHFANIILATTELERINSAIQSRAGNSIYRFDYPTIEAVTANLMRISALEHLPTTADAAEVIADVGDCQPRKCLDALQELTIVARHRNLHEISAAFVRDVLHIPTKGPSGDQPDIRGL
jgi:DNA polymerase III gamma/tau subunit